MTVSSKAYAGRTAAGLRHHNTLVVVTYRVRLCDPFNNPMPHTPYRLKVGGRTLTGKADEGGWVDFISSKREERCFAEWGTPEEVLEEQPSEADCPSPRDLLQAPAAGSADLDEGRQTGEVSVTVPRISRPVEGYAYRLEIYLDLEEHDEDEAMRRRMHNLGVFWSGSMDDDLHALRWSNPTRSSSVEEVKKHVRRWHDDCEHRPHPAARPPRTKS
jgi:hypothetical protein